MLATFNVLNETSAKGTSSSNWHKVNISADGLDPTVPEYIVLVTVGITSKVAAFSLRIRRFPILQTIPTKVFGSS